MKRVFLSLLLLALGSPSFAAIAYVADAATQSADNTAHTIDVGTPSSGDFMLMFAVTDSGFGTGLDCAAGWTSIVNNEITGITGGSSARYMLCYKFAGGSESDVSITLSAIQEVVASVARFTGVDTSTPIDAAFSATNLGSTANNADAPSINTVTNGAFWIAGAANDDDREARGGGAGLTIIRDEASNALANGNGVGLNWGYAEIATAGATGTTNFTLTAAEEVEAFSLALRPSGAAASSALLRRRRD